MSIGNRVKKLREELEVTQLKLSRMLDVTPNDISRLEKGEKTKFSTDFLIKLAACLHTTVEYLVEGRGMRKIISKEELQVALNDREALLENLSKEELAHHYEKLKKRQEDLVSQIKQFTKNIGEIE